MRVSRSPVALLPAAGFLAAVVQVYLVRELLVLFVGNELCLALIYTCWFAAIGLGAAAGGLLARRLGASNRLTAAAAALLPLAGMAAVVGSRLWRGLAGLEPGQLVGPADLLPAVALLASPAGLLVGLLFPLACRLLGTEQDGRVIGRAYLAETLGAVAGGLAAALVLAGRVPALTALWLAAGPLSWALARLPAGGAARRRLLVPLVVLLAWAALLWPAARLDALTGRMRFEQLQTGLQRVAQVESPYHLLELGRRGRQYTLLADGKALETFPDPYTARLRAHLVMCQHPRPRYVLVANSFSLELLPPLLAHPLRRLDLVLQDERLGQLVTPYLGEAVLAARQDQRLRLASGDGRRFLLERPGKRWDLIFSEAADPTTAAQNRFFTREFFALARSRLRSGGVLVVRISGSANYLGRHSAGWLGTVRQALAEVFSNVVLIAGRETFLVASDDARAPLADPVALGERYLRRAVDDPEFTPYHFATIVQPEMARDFEQQLRERGRVTANSDSRPLAYLLGLQRWSRESSGALLPGLDSLQGLPAWSWPVLLALLAAGWWLLRLLPAGGRGTRAAALDTLVFIAGLVGMAADLVVLYAYQALLGSLYREVGLVLAAFMAGLALGGGLANRLLAREPTGRWMLPLAGLALALSCLLLAGLLALVPAVASVLLIRVLLLAAALVVAGVVGAIFPLAGARAVEKGMPLSLAAGSLDTQDHLGALAGALLGGLALLPAAGVVGSALALAVAAATAGALCGMVAWRYK